MFNILSVHIYSIKEGSNSAAPLKPRQTLTSHWDQSMDSRLKLHPHFFSTRIVSYLHYVIWFENRSGGSPKTSWKSMSECLKGVLGDETKVTSDLWCLYPNTISTDNIISISERRTYHRHWRYAPTLQFHPLITVPTLSPH